LRRAVCLFIAVITAFIAGCAGPLEVRYEPKGEGPSKLTEPVSIHVATFADRRGGDPRDLGRITVPVADMNGSRLVISEEAASLVTRAYIRELGGAGFVIAPKKDGADFIAEGEVRALSYSIEGRDEYNVELAFSIFETETGRAVWSGVESEKGSRFAGVMGNSRATISASLTDALSKAMRRALAKANPMIHNTTASYAPAKEAAEAAAPPPEGTGRLVIKSSPGRAKVYMGDVYYGMTPLSLDLGPGVYEITLKRKGYKDSGEKVSVRTGQFTELELDLEKERQEQTY